MRLIATYFIASEEVWLFSISGEVKIFIFCIKNKARLQIKKVCLGANYSEACTNIFSTLFKSL